MKQILFCLALLSTLLLACSKEKTMAEPINCDGVDIGFTESISPIFSNECAVSGCHSGPGDDGGFSLDGLEAIRSAVNSGRPVIERVDAGEMPPSDSLNQNDIDRLKCWIGAGMPG